MKALLILVLMTQISCSGFAAYTIVTAGTLSGKVIADNYEDWFDTRPHYYHLTYKSKAHCQEAKELFKNKGTVCTDKHDLYVTK